MKIAVYGGSFDPPHLGHMEIIRESLRALEIDKLIVMVAYQNPLKKRRLFSSAHRLSWLRKLCEGIDGVVVSDFEVRHAVLYSAESVLHLERLYCPQKIYFILGEDNFSELPRWTHYDILSQKVEFVLVRREGFEYNAPTQELKEIVLRNIDYPLSSSMLRNEPSLLTARYIPEQILDEVVESFEGERLRQERLDFIIEKLSEKKAENIECIDVSDKDYIVDCVIIATAMAGRHTYALLDMLKSELKPRGETFYAVDEESEDWIVIDLGDIMIHIFTQSHREKFNLEEFLKQELAREID